MSDEHETPGVSVDGKLVITDLLGLGKAVEKLTPAATKLVEAIQAGAGKLYEPASLYLNSRASNAANRHNALADAKAFRELETRSPAVLQSMRERILGVEYRREENIHAAQIEAAKIAQTSQKEAHDIDPDFYVEWMEGVKDVSNDEVRNIWSRLLAHAPTEKTGRIPKPALDLLRLFDSELAKGFLYLCEISYASDYCIPTLPASRLVSKFAEEIGIGSFEEWHSIKTTLPWLRLSAEQGKLYVFRMGARARAIADVIMSTDARRQSEAQFVVNFTTFLQQLGVSSELGGITLHVTDAERRQKAFTVEFHNGKFVEQPASDIHETLQNLQVATGRPKFEMFRDQMLRLERNHWLLEGPDDPEGDIPF